MKVQTIDSQVWWIALADEIRPIEGFDTAAFGSEIGRTFEFREPPKIGQNNVGAEFLDGYLREEGEVVSIQKIAIYNDGINVVVQGRSSSAEKVLQRVLSLAHALGVRQPVTPPAHHYLSTVVVDYEKSLDGLMPPAFLNAISNAAFRKKAQFLSIAFSADAKQLSGQFSGLNPTSFSIGRRIDVPFSMNRYFSQAAMSTEEHLDILQQLENLV